MTLHVKWPWLFWLILGLAISGLALKQWLDARSQSYSPPALSELTVSKGKIGFTERWKSSGGDLVLQLSNGKKLRLACGGPNGTSACYLKRVNGQWVSFKDRLSGKEATVWWHAGDRPQPGWGWVYQVEVDGQLFMQYQDQVERRLENQRQGNPISLGVAILFFLILVVPSLYKIFRR